MFTIHDKDRLKTYMQLMYQSNRSLNNSPPHPPASIARAFDVFCCPGGREFDEVSLPRGRGVGVGNLIASFDFMLRYVDSTWRDKSWRRQAFMHSKREIPIQGGLAEKQRLAQVLLSI